MPTFPSPSPSPQLPAEIWLKILTYIPKSTSLRERNRRDMLIGVNRVFFDHFMDERYWTLKVQRDASGKLRDWRRIVNINLAESCAKRVRHLYIDASAIGILESALRWDDGSSVGKGQKHHESKKKSFISRLTTSISLPHKHTNRRSLTYPKVQQLISRLSSIEHLQVYLDDSGASISSFHADNGYGHENGNEEMPRLRSFFESIWFILFPRLTQISLHTCPELLPYLLPGRTMRPPEAQLLQVNSISIAFIISFTTHNEPTSSPSPSSVNSLDPWESECIDSISRLINSARASLTTLCLRDWYGYAAFPSLLSRLEPLSRLHSVDLRTHVPASAIHSRAYLPVTTATASAVVSFLTNHDSTLRCLSLDLMEGWAAPPESTSIICETVLAPYLRLSGIRELTINPLARTSRTSASVGLIDNLIAGYAIPPTTHPTSTSTPTRSRGNNEQIARLTIKSYIIFELDLETLLISQSNRLHNLVYLELGIQGAFTRRLLNAFMEKLPALQSLNLRFQSVCYSSNNGDMDNSLELFLGSGPLPSSKFKWSPQTILITIEVQSPNPTYPNTYLFQSSALVMMALCVLFPTIHSFLQGHGHYAHGITYDDLRMKMWYEHLRLRIERVWPDNWLYSPHVSSLAKPTAVDEEKETEGGFSGHRRPGKIYRSIPLGSE
ncbi:hypothetical protein ONZ45_g6754 [Pleurotus djamor]|nr:hypothetical protein ONZ45_g6754 [Pleurotus djamor]